MVYLVFKYNELIYIYIYMPEISELGPEVRRHILINVCSI